MLRQKLGLKEKSKAQSHAEIAIVCNVASGRHSAAKAILDNKKIKAALIELDTKKPLGHPKSILNQDKRDIINHAKTIFILVNARYQLEPTISSLTPLQKSKDSYIVVTDDPYVMVEAQNLDLGCIKVESLLNQAFTPIRKIREYLRNEFLTGKLSAAEFKEVSQVGYIQDVSVVDYREIMKLQQKLLGDKQLTEDAGIAAFKLYQYYLKLGADTGHPFYNTYMAEGHFLPRTKKLLKLPPDMKQKDIEQHVKILEAKNTVVRKEQPGLSSEVKTENLKQAIVTATAVVTASGLYSPKLALAPDKKIDKDEQVTRLKRET